MVPSAIPDCKHTRGNCGHATAALDLRVSTPGNSKSYRVWSKHQDVLH